MTRREQRFVEGSKAVEAVMRGKERWHGIDGESGPFVVSL